jgi:hypothetical protein
LSFMVAACARPMMAGDKITPAAVVCKNRRRLKPGFMRVSPKYFLLACTLGVALSMS